eukprot:COSAG06_NODE_71348_length_185_cov_20.395349_1_plen_34_part_10
MIYAFSYRLPEQPGLTRLLPRRCRAVAATASGKC